MADPVRRRRTGRSDRPAPVGSPEAVHRGATGRGHSVGLRTARQARRAAVHVWTCLDLALEVVTAGIADSITASTVRRILADDAIKPWQHRSWISVRDPDFAVKAKHVLDLYARSWEGEPLGADDYVISCDEKTSIQARCRCHPTLPPGRSRTMRVC